MNIQNLIIHRMTQFIFSKSGYCLKKEELHRDNAEDIYNSLSELKVGSVFKTKLNSSRHGIILLGGEVLWSRPKQDGEGYIVGIHFLPMDKEVEKTLKDFLEEWST